MIHSMHSHASCPACGDLDGCHLPGRERAGCLSLEQFWDVHSEWSQKTFGADSKRGPLGPLKHLQKEAVEATEAAIRLSIVGTEQDHGLEGVGEVEQAELREEITDCLFLVFDAARRSGMTYGDLVREVNAKLKKNKARTWPKPTSDDEPVEHVRSDQHPG